MSYHTKNIDIERMYPMNKKRILSFIAVVMVLLSMLPMAFAAPEVAGDAANGEPLPWYAASGIIQFAPIVIMVLVFYFFLIRPENKRKKETAQMRDSLKVGDKVVTIGGIIGRIVKVKDDEIFLETSTDKNKLVFKKWAISSVEKAAEKAPEKESEDAE